MPHFITKHPAIQITNPLVEPPTEMAVTFDDLVRALFASDKLLQRIDVFSAGDARADLLKASVGDVVKVSDEVYEALRSLILPPKGEAPAVSPAMAYGGASMLRSITDAPTTSP